MEHSSTMYEVDPNLLLVPSYGQNPIGNTLKQHSERNRKEISIYNESHQNVYRDKISSQTMLTVILKHFHPLTRKKENIFLGLLFR